MLLHKQRVRPRWMKRNAMHAMSNFRCWIRKKLRMQTAINWFPGFTAVVCAKRAGSGYRDGNSVRIFRIKKNRVQTHAARAWLPFRTGIAAAQSGQFMPGFPAILRFEQRGVFHAGINMIRIVKRRFQMPDPLESPGILCAVVPLVRRERHPWEFKRVWH